MSNATDDHGNTTRPERAIDNTEAWEDTRDLQAYATRTYGLDPTSVGQLIDWCEGAARAAGRPFARVIERRWDEGGEPVGPDDRIGRDEAEIVLDVVEAVTRARSTALAAAIEPKVAAEVQDGSSALRRRRGTNCDTTWCVMNNGVDHDQYHAGDPVDLAGSDGSGYRGWWAWLTKERRAHCDVQVVFEGFWEDGSGQEVTITAADLAVIMAATATPDARETLVALLAAARVEVPA